MPTDPAPSRNVQFRLHAETLAQLDRIAAHLAAETHSPATRATALRYAVARTAAALAEGEKKSRTK